MDIKQSANQDVVILDIEEVIQPRRIFIAGEEARNLIFEDEDGEPTITAERVAMLFVRKLYEDN